MQKKVIYGNTLTLMCKRIYHNCLHIFLDQLFTSYIYIILSQFFKHIHSTLQVHSQEFHMHSKTFLNCLNISQWPPTLQCLLTPMDTSVSQERYCTYVCTYLHLYKELYPFLRYRKTKLYNMAGSTESSSAVNKYINSPTESVTGGQQDEILMQPLDPNSMISFLLYPVCVVCVLCVVCIQCARVSQCVC